MTTDYRSSTKLAELPTRMLNGLVLIRINPDEYLKIGNLLLGDMESINTEKKRYNPANHAVRHGVVVVAPIGYSILGETKASIDVVAGDIVWFDYLTGINADLYEYNNEYYYILPYSSLIVRKRGDEIYPLNGQLLCEAVVEKKSFMNYEIDEIISLKAVVRFIGQIPEHSTKHPPSINVGDTIITRQPVIFLEDKHHLFLDGNMYRFISIFNVDAVYDKIKI